ncbi:MAG: diacylglycerol/lipid kinase family protein [Aggregatilineales bacterium]
MSENRYQNIHVIINPASGQDATILNILNRVFHSRGVEWTVSITQKDGDGKRMAEDAMKNDVDLIVAYGGDGTVMDVASALIGTEMPLGILPGGTGNALALGLGIPDNLEQAAELLCSEDSEVHQLDIGQANDRYFVLRLMTGPGVKMLQYASREMKDRFGNLAYILAWIRTLGELPQASQYSLTIDGESVEVDGIACVVANAGNMGRISISEDIDPTDGLLDVIVVDRPEVIMQALAAELIRSENIEPGIKTWQCREVTIEVDNAQPVTVDGEAGGETPVTAKLHPQALKVLVPATTDSNENDSSQGTETDE